MKRATSIRFEEDTLEVLRQLAELKRISQRAVIEMLIRQEARREGLLQLPAPGLSGAAKKKAQAAAEAEARIVAGDQAKDKAQTEAITRMLAQEEAEDHAEP